MRNKNTLNKLEFVWDNLYWSALMLLLYRGLFFCPVFGLDCILSAVILVGSVVLGAVTGILLTYKRRRNYTSIFCNLVLSFAPYYIMTFWNVFRVPMIIAGYVAAGIVLGYCVLVLISYFSSKQTVTNKASGWQWLGTCFLSSRVLVSIVFGCLLLSSGLKPMLGMPVLEFKADTITTEQISNEEGATISKNMDTVLLLQEDEWSKLNASARLKVLKTISEIEANYLGIESMTVCAEHLGENTMGHYNDSTRTITLNLSYLSTSDARTMLATLCHECYHAYQHRLVDLYNQMDSESKELLLFRDAAYYKDEFSNYIDGSKNYEGYSMQRCELDSEKYAEDAVADYYYRIYQYNEERNGGDVG